MMGFERFNKFIKGMCFNKHFPMESVANAYIRNAAAHYLVCDTTTRQIGPKTLRDFITINLALWLPNCATPDQC